MNGSRWQDRRVWLGGGALAGLLVIVASWLLVISPALDSAADLRNQEADAQTQNTQTVTKNNKLARQFEQIGVKKRDLIDAIAALPTTTDLPAFTLQVTSLAKAAKVSLGSIAFSQPTAAGASDTTSSDTTSSNGASPGATSATGSSTTASPTTTATTVTLSTTGSADSQTTFLAELRTGERRALITSAQFANSGPKTTTLTTQLTIFSAAMPKAQLDSINRDLRAN